MIPITVSQLKRLCDEEIKKGNANKVIMISDDDEGNGYHYLWYEFSKAEDIDDIEWFIDNSIADKKHTIILG